MSYVSVIIPTYNRKLYVQEAVDSVLAQTYTDYEIIVIDDGSTDGTSEALSFRYGDKIQYVWQENQGESVARNRGVELAQGKYIAFLDSDDLWLPEKLSEQILFLDKYPNFSFVFTQAWQIDADGRKVSDRKINESVQPEFLILERLCFDNLVEAPSTVIVARNVLQASGGFDPGIRYGEDYDLFLRLRLFTDMGIIPQPLACIRKHEGSQCHFPSAEINAQRREAHLLALKKLFDLWTEATPELQRQAFAWQYAKSALLEAVARNELSTKVCLEQAATYDPGLFTRNQRFGRAVATQAAWLYESEQNLSSSVSFVKFVLKALAEAGYYNRSIQRKILTQSYLSLGFTSYQVPDNKVTRHCLIRALALNPSNIKNIGLLSLLFEATFGKRISNLVRKFFQRML